jgi:hypothetical protein
MDAGAVVPLAIGLADRGGTTRRGWRATSLPLRNGGPGLHLVPQVCEAVAKVTPLDELQLDGQGEGPGVLTACDRDRCHEQLAFIHKPGLERMGSQVGTGDRDVTLRRQLHCSHSLCFEHRLESRS